MPTRSQITGAIHVRLGQGKPASVTFLKDNADLYEEIRGAVIKKLSSHAEKA